MDHSLTYPRKLTQSVGTAVTCSERMILEVHHLDLVEMHITDAIKESSDADRMGFG